QANPPPTAPPAVATKPAATAPPSPISGPATSASPATSPVAAASSPSPAAGPAVTGDTTPKVVAAAYAFLATLDATPDLSGPDQRVRGEVCLPVSPRAARLAAQGALSGFSGTSKVGRSHS